MEFTYLIFTVTVLANIVLAAFVYADNPRSASNRLYAGLSIAISFWMITMLMTWVPDLFPEILFLVRLNLVATTTMNVFFLLFGKTVPDQRMHMDRRWLAVLLASAGAVILLSVSPLTFVDIPIEDGVPHPVTGPGLTIFGLFQFALILVTVAIIFLKIRRSEGVRSMQLRLVLYGFLLMSGLLFGTVFVPILLHQDAALVPFAPMYVLLFLVPSGYAIFRHKLLDVKVVAAELFSAALIFINAVQLFLSRSISDLVMRTLVFVAVIFIAMLFIRSVRAEVRRRKEVQRLAERLQNANKRLRKLDDLKTTMVSIASHQLRGPLGGMKGYFTMFRDGDLGPLTDKQKEIVKMNLNTLSRLMNAVETFLDISKLDAGKMTLHKEVLPLDTAVREVAHEFEIMVRRKGLELETDIEEDVWVKFDPEKIKHVIFNLVDNALKYTEEGRITASLHREDGEAVIRVSDTGQGIPPEDLPRLFGKFERGELVIDRGGSGLGLYVVKMLTEMQGGEASVSSPGAGKGSTFTVRLPLARVP